MSKRRLIVNADDCNLTRGVTQAILDCHDRGILSSTTFMANLPVDEVMLGEVKRRKNLGVGIHLNVTMGEPILPARRVPSLLTAEGLFRKRDLQLSQLPRPGELAAEYQAQVDFFRKLFGRGPTHLDTHHQMHDHPLFFDAVARIAARNHLPVRRSLAMRASCASFRTTDFLFGNLTVSGYWRKTPLVTVLTHLPEGTSEIMCHPGKVDRALSAVSSFTSGRAVEHDLFRDHRLLRLLQDQGILLAHFGVCYT